MLKDADPAYFAGIYIVCGYIDLRYGIDSLAAIIERKYHMNLFIPNTLFLFCGRSASKFQLNFCFSLCKTENFFLVSSQLSDEQLHNLDKEALIIIVSSLQDQLLSLQSQLDHANAQLSETNRQIELLTEQFRIMNQRHFGRKSEANLSESEGQLSL